jgi:hypothetical protein
VPTGSVYFWGVHPMLGPSSKAQSYQLLSHPLSGKSLNINDISSLPLPDPPNGLHLLSVR